jgi:hypothetical protein
VTFLVQTDIGVAGAVSYVSVEDFRTYHADRGTDVAAYSIDNCQAALVQATDYLDGRWSFSGERVSTTQRTAWPRINAYDEDDNLRSGIPVEVVEACCEYALIALTTELNPSPTSDVTGRAVQRQATAVGPISKEVEYASGAAFKLPKYPKADMKIRSLTTRGGLELVRG